MKYNITDYKVQTIVEQLGEEYKDLLIERVLEDTHEIDADQINPSDLIRLDVTTKANLRQDRKGQRLNFMASMVAILGLLYALVGFLVILWDSLKSTIRYNSTLMMAFILIFTGLLVALFSMIFRYTIKLRPQYYKSHRHIISSYEVVNKWKEIEALINQLTPEKDSSSLSSMVMNLKETKIITNQDLDFIDELLNIRNKIVHEKDIDSYISQEELRSVLIESDKIINKMKRIL